MSDVRKFHQLAMELLQKSIVARHNGDSELCRNLCEQAYGFEIQSADLIANTADVDNEPTRSILYRSSASLAYQAGKFDFAKEAINKCLAGNPSEAIKHEIALLLEEMKHTRQLKKGM